MPSLRSPLSTAAALLPPRPARCPRHALPTAAHSSRADQSGRTSVARTNAVSSRGHAQRFKIDERRERARHTPSEFVRVEVAAHPKRTRPLGGTTPHRQLPAHGTHRRGAPGELLTHMRSLRPPLSTAAALLPPRPARCPRHALPTAARSEQSRPIGHILGRTRRKAAGTKGARTDM